MVQLRGVYLCLVFIYGLDVMWKAAVRFSRKTALSRAGEKAVEGMGCSINYNMCHF